MKRVGPAWLPSSCFSRIGWLIFVCTAYDSVYETSTTRTLEISMVPKEMYEILNLRRKLTIYGRF